MMHDEIHAGAMSGLITRPELVSNCHKGVTGHNIINAYFVLLVLLLYSTVSYLPHTHSKLSFTQVSDPPLNCSAGSLNHLLLDFKDHIDSNDSDIQCTPLLRC